MSHYKYSPVRLVVSLRPEVGPWTVATSKRCCKRAVNDQPKAEGLVDEVMEEMSSSEKWGEDADVEIV